MLLLPATVSIADARSVLRLLEQSLAREPADQLLIDAGGLQDFDSSVLAVLLECRRLAQASGRTFAMRHAPSRLSQLARLHGVDGLLGLNSEPLATAVV
jgi:phospholipid transport system transporter-binding protein